jgi:hypothetical protein
MAGPLCIKQVVFLKNQTYNQTRVYLVVELEPELESKTLKIKSEWNPRFNWSLTKPPGPV